jgi:hypothetical protein
LDCVDGEDDKSVEDNKTLGENRLDKRASKPNPDEVSVWLSEEAETSNDSLIIFGVSDDVIIDLLSGCSTILSESKFSPVVT